jgi:hypothetical protein
MLRAPLPTTLNYNLAIHSNGLSETGLADARLARHQHNTALAGLGLLPAPQ